MIQGTTPPLRVHLGMLLGIFTTLALVCAPLSAEDRPVVANWVVETHDGRQISLYDEAEKGNTVIAVFWATWCRYCRDLLPKLDKFHRDHRDQNITVIAMNIWEDGDPLAYVKQRKISLPLVLKAERVAQQYGVIGTPAVYVIGPDRRLAYERRAGQSNDEVIAAVQASLPGK